MRNITPMFQKYREVARHLRNTFYIPADKNGYDWDIEHDFNELSTLLFEQFLLREFKIQRGGFSWLVEPSSLFLVEPSAEEIPIMISREGQYGYWDNPVQRVRKGANPLMVEFAAG